VARAVLAPASAAYRVVTGLRNALYDRGTLAIERPPIPVVSIGNLSVGGTGKTPVAAWVANQLYERGARPTIILRGYGRDEPAVHARLNPHVPVIVNTDRCAAVRAAAAGGADVAVLDDGFQHRRLSRSEDVVLVSADRWREPIRLLPSGPWRERPSALLRASLVIVTRKAAEREAAATLMRRLARLTSTGTGAVASLQIDSIQNARTGTARPATDLAGSRVLAVAGVGDPEAFCEQLQRIGAVVVLNAFPDHHDFTDRDVRRLAAQSLGFDHICCTLKDAVKLGPRWPREAPPLWYVSLRCVVEVGEAEVAALLARVIAARPPNAE
jgi:tetraacyldisaccharide 4'-kinase